MPRTETERELWSEHLCKILDINNGIPIQFKLPSKIYLQKVADFRKQFATDQESLGGSQSATESKDSNLQGKHQNTKKNTEP